MTTIHLCVGDALLRRALRLSLLSSGFATVESEAEADVIITTVNDMALAAVEAEGRRGARILVLAPLPRERERDAYLLAGASAYVPMSGGRESLVHVVELLFSRG